MAKAPTEIRSKARAHTDRAICVLIEIMEDRSAPVMARVAAATEILNRGLGKLTDPQRFAPLQQQFYVYSIHDRAGKLIYVGKGTERRHLNSARRFDGRSRIRAEFENEEEALRFERRVIERFRPECNTVFNRVA